MLKMALFDRAINEKCCSVDGGRGICTLFSSSPRGIWTLNIPHPREFAIQGKTTLIPGGQPGGGGAVGIDWCMKLRLIVMFINLEYRARERQRKRKSRRQASEAQWEKGRQRSMWQIKSKGDFFVLLEEQHENFVAVVTKWEILAATYARWKRAAVKIKVNENVYGISSIKRITNKFLDVLRCSSAKQRQRNVLKKCVAREKLLFC